MTEPSEIIEVWWVETPPFEAFFKHSDTHYECPHRDEHYVLWRNRWCVVSGAILVADGFAFNTLDNKMAEGSLGLMWRKRE